MCIRDSFKTALLLVFLNAFGSAITPFQGGGGPILIYVLRNNGVPIGKGLALALTRTVVTVVLLGVFVPLSLIFVPDVFKESVAMMGVFLYATIFALLFGLLVIVSIVKSDFIKHLVKVVTLRMDRIDALNLRVFSIVRFFNKQIDLYAQNMKLLFTGGIFRFILLIFLTLGYLFSAIFVLPVLAWALGISISLKKAILIQGLFFFVLYFVPTPGASGIAAVSYTHLNILRALALAKEKGLKTIGFTGMNVANMRLLCDVLLSVPSEDTPRIQEVHMLWGHIIRCV